MGGRSRSATIWWMAIAAAIVLPAGRRAAHADDKTPGMWPPASRPASQRPASLPSSGPPAAPPTAAELSPADAEAYDRAEAAAQAGHPEEAWRLLSPLMARPRPGKSNAQLWTRLARLAAAIGALSAAEGAIGHGARGDAELEKIAGDVEAARHRVALPSGGAKAGVEPDREPAYVAGFRETEGLVAEAHFDPAASRARLRDFAAAFPGAPGVELLTCDLELRANHAALAAQHCDKAVAQAKEASRAYFLLGLIATRAHRDNVAESRLRSAILLDPETPDAWRALAKLYRGLGAHARLAELDDKHRVLFSTPLPE